MLLDLGVCVYIKNIPIAYFCTHLGIILILSYRFKYVCLYVQLPKELIYNSSNNVHYITWYKCLWTRLGFYLSPLIWNSVMLLRYFYSMDSRTHPLHPPQHISFWLCHEMLLTTIFSILEYFLYMLGKKKLLTIIFMIYSIIPFIK